MTRPVIPPTPNVPDSTVSELHALYHVGTSAEPSLRLDRRILDAARAELQADSAMKSRRQAPWWKRWLAPASAIAVAVLGLSLTWRVMDEQERDLRAKMIVTEGTQKGVDETVGKVAPEKQTTAAQQSINAQAPTGHRAESKAAQNLPSAVPGQAAKPATGAEPRAFPAQQEVAKREATASGSLARSTETAQAPILAAPAAASPMPTPEALKKRSDADELREKIDTGDASNTGSGLAPPLGKLGANRRSASSSAETAADASTRSATDAAAKSPDDAATPEVWLKHIRELRAAGRNAEAVQSLARFRVRYPDFVLPDDLLKLK